MGSRNSEKNLGRRVQMSHYSRAMASAREKTTGSSASASSRASASASASSRASTSSSSASARNQANSNAGTEGYPSAYSVN